MDAYPTWNAYLDALYEGFCEDFVHSKPTFRGRPFRLKKHPVTNGKEATFWHLIQSGSNEPDRLPDLRRCERVRWPRALIENGDNDNAVKIWTNSRGRDTRVCLWLDEQDYLVILADRGNYLLLWTAYETDRNHTRAKLKKEWMKSQVVA